MLTLLKLKHDVWRTITNKRWEHGQRGHTEASRQVAGKSKLLRKKASVQGRTGNHHRADQPLRVNLGQSLLAADRYPRLTAGVSLEASPMPWEEKRHGHNNTVCVVTGGNRGIGLGFVKALLARPPVTVIATVRNDQARTTLEDATVDLVKGDGAIWSIAQLNFTTAHSPDQIRKAFDIDHVDVLINNAAASSKSYPVLDIPADDIRSAIEINTIGPLTVTQGLWPLLKKSSAPKVVNVSSSVGCITYHEVVAGAYGPSKATFNWITRALHQQNDDLIAFALHPGFVNTEMGESAATEWGFPHAMLEGVEEVMKGSLGIIDSATRENVSGKFVSYEGQELPW
ncbi:hypothetical protein FAGAP_4111 [Fusarium agapanthi]|uniref:Ketoreductase n=1 Tax=Fusarium agapanthi TaxID=1803897 RepID=A0A9P5BFT6_9HYPO|nr:hypothetical protein FAGAP_4111 [Fusarium agapanthi]